MALRRNLCPNPALGVDLTGWGGNPGNVTLSRAAVTGFDRPYAAEASWTWGSYVASARASVSEGLSYAASGYMRHGAGIVVDVRAYIYWYDNTGAVLGQSDTKTTGIAGGTVTRLSHVATAPAGAVSAALVLYNDDFDQYQIYATVDVTQVLIEQTTVVDPYADGDTAGWQWDGTPGLSTSSETTATEVSVVPADVTVEALAASAVIAYSAAPADVIAAALPTALVHPSPAEVVVEALSVTVAHHVETQPSDTAVEATYANARATHPDPVDVVVEALPVRFGIAGQLPSRRAPAAPLALPLTRVLAQSILSGQWLSWELPVTDLEITWSLSGPTMITGEFTPEITALTDLGLEAWGTWIHVEDSGLIRASAILQPTSLDGETLSLQAVGPMGYAARIPYRGVFSGIQVDPADMVRHLWDHIQSHPRGDLGIAVYGSTPVRIGTPEVDVEFTTETGEHVDFSAGPYKLQWWENTLCGREIDQLAAETPFDYLERAAWNADKTAVEHWIDLAHPRIGRRLSGLHFAQGENILEVAPLEEPENAYASQVYVHGKGEGVTTVTGYAGRDVGGRLRLPVVVEDQSVGTKTRARALASEQLAARQAALVEVPEIAIDVRHPNAPLGSFAPGDEIAPQLQLAYVGQITAWHRITAIRYRPEAEAAALSLTRRSEFSDR